jgi:hypothetical protein
MPKPAPAAKAGCSLMINAILIAILMVWVSFPVGPALAQEDESEERATAAVDTVYKIPSMSAVRRSGEIQIDGIVDEAAWQLATPTTRFLQREPVEGAQPSEQTEVRVLYDEGALYLGAIMYDSQPEGIARQLVRRDQRGQFDYITFSVDSNGDKRTGYRFRVSAAGVQRDEYLFNDEDSDDAWNAVWESDVAITNTGWSAEMRIPLSQISYNPSEEEQTWGVNFRRRRISTNETLDFSIESRIRYGRVSVFGHLDGILLPNSARRIELRPYALSSARTAPSTIGNPFFDGSEFNRRFGLDMRYGLGSAHTLDVTINPDFGQVEVDPAVVNLSAFEVFFRERRPFFVSDAQVFNYRLSGRSSLFYSRRIGRQPRGNSPFSSDFEEIPTQTRILTAAKLTGRSQGGLAIGAMAALTREESGRSFLASSNQFQTFTVEPRTAYGVLRARQDFRGGGTQFGAITTLMHRQIPSGGAFDFLPSDAYSGGIDFEHNWGGDRSRNWAVSGFFAGSRTVGTPEALVRIQRASNHFFQRPDATRFSVDSTATSISGFNWRMQLDRQSSEHWTGGIWLAEVSPGFEVNDLGFSTSSERIDGGASLSYREIRPGSLFRNYSFRGFTFYNFRHEALDEPFSPSSWSNAYKSGTFRGSADFEFNNFWELELDAGFAPRRISDSATRGGPLMESPAEYSLAIEVGTDGRKFLAARPSVEYQNDSRGGSEWELRLRTSYRPSPSWEFEIQPRFETQHNPAQYVSSTDDIGFLPTFGPRYIFSDLRRRSFSLETRMNITFSPRLSLQLFAQPLISSGDYKSYKSLTTPGGFSFDVFEEGTRTYLNPADAEERLIDFEGDGVSDFTLSDRDFNIRSLRMNMVLRWEYRPGSTVFFVWQQSRRDRLNDGRFRLGNDFGSIFNAEAENIFIVKFNYWFGV